LSFCLFLFVYSIILLININFQAPKKKKATPVKRGRAPAKKKATPAPKAAKRAAPKRGKKKADTESEELSDDLSEEDEPLQKKQKKFPSVSSI